MLNTNVKCDSAFPSSQSDNVVPLAASTVTTAGGVEENFAHLRIRSLHTAGTRGEWLLAGINRK